MRGGKGGGGGGGQRSEEGRKERTNERFIELGRLPMSGDIFCA